MKICYVTNLYPPISRGGAEVVVQTEARALADAGHEVCVVTTAPAGSGLPDTEIVEGVKVRRFTPPNIFFYTDAHKHSLFMRFMWHLMDMFGGRAARRVGEILRDELPDVVHTHNLMGVSFLVPAVLRRMRIPHVHTLHDVQMLHPSGLLPADGSRVPVPPRFARAVYIALMRMLAGSPAAVVSPSKYLADMHLRRGFFRKSRVVILPNPVSDQCGDPVTGARGPRFLFAGQIERHKGILFLLEAWRRFGNGTGAVLEIAGTGALDSGVLETVGGMKGVEIAGRLDRKGMCAAYFRAAYVVVPSLVIENAPAVIGESFAHGVPVIASAAGGIPEFVRDGETGFLFAPGDAESLLKALQKAVDSLPDRERMSAKARESARQFSVRRHTEKLQELYKAVIEKG